MLKNTSSLSYVIKRLLYRRTSNAVKENVRATNDIVWETIENNKINTTADWKSVRDIILNNCGPRSQITHLNIDALTVGICTSKKEYDLALSYIGFLEKEQIKLNLATLGKYLKLLYIKGVDKDFSEEDEQKILMLYKNVRKTYPVLDVSTLEHMIQAISLTKEWRECLDLLNEMKIASSPTCAAYGAATSAAFLNGEDELAWKLMEETLEQNKLIGGIVYSSYFKKVARLSKKSEKIKELEKLFNFLHNNSVIIESEVSANLAELLKEINVKVSPSSVTHRGICNCCKSKLNSFDLSEEEFSELKTKILQNVIVGKDVFNKTTPEELKRFETFISNMKSFDVVIDGLNVAYSVGAKQSPFVTSALVSSVVSHFVNYGQKVLVLGRSHMNKWPKQNWGYVLQNATVFLMQDLSQDDPYLLYCALHSGKDTKIVTRDLMRSHRFLLKNVHLKNMFDRWLNQRQYQLIKVQDAGSPIFKKPLPFAYITQQNNNYWHVPYVVNTPPKTPVSYSWLCIQY